MSHATVITVRDGELVQEPADEHFARIERERAEAAERTVQRHVANLLGLSQLHQRQEYLINLERREGAEAAARVRADVAAQWAARRGQA